MPVLRFDGVDAFLERVGPHVNSRPIVNNLLLGIVNSIRHGTLRGDAYLAAVEEGASLQAAAVLMPPFKLVLSEGDAACLPALVEDLAEDGRAPPGVVGPVAMSEACVAAWTARTGGATRPGIEMVLHALRRLAIGIEAPGEMRRANPEEIDMLGAWMAQFAAEAGLDPEERKASAESVANAIERRRMRVWVAYGRPVAMADYRSISDDLARIGPVYTVPEARGKGYGTALVATLCETMLRSRIATCLIFADVANPRATGIYRRIGFEPVCTYREYYFG